MPAAQQQSTSSSRPTSGVSPQRSASNRLCDAALAKHLPSAAGSAKPFSACGAEIGELEQTRRLSACAFGDDDARRFGKRLQAGGEVRRLADDPALLRGAGAIRSPTTACPVAMPMRHPQLVAA